MAGQPSPFRGLSSSAAIPGRRSTLQHAAALTVNSLAGIITLHKVALGFI